MNIVTTVEEWLKIRKSINSRSIGFVATMGNLHAGHLSLCRRAKAENKLAVVSIFINPTQFNQLDDYIAYPRTLDADGVLLENEKIDYLFLPTKETLYPDNYAVRIEEMDLSLELEGKYRPGHFGGMLTVVLKLLNLIQPCRAYFGEKDYQQLLLIKKLVTAYFLQTEIVHCETVRDMDGLALSSRNSRLTEAQRATAAHFPRVLQSDLSLDQMMQALAGEGFRIDYIAEKWQRRLAAVWLDNVRLIDNIPILAEE